MTMLFKTETIVCETAMYLCDSRTQRVIALYPGGGVVCYDGNFPIEGFFSDAKKITILSQEMFDVIFECEKQATIKKTESEKLAQESWEMTKRKREQTHELFHLISENG